MGTEAKSSKVIAASLYRTKGYKIFLAFEVMLLFPAFTYFFIYHRDWFMMYSHPPRFIPSWLLPIDLLIVACVGQIGASMAYKTAKTKPREVLATFIVSMVVLFASFLIAFVIFFYKQILFYGDYDTFNLAKKMAGPSDFFKFSILHSPLLAPLVYFFVVCIIASLYAIYKLSVPEGDERRGR